MMEERQGVEALRGLTEVLERKEGLKVEREVGTRRGAQTRGLRASIVVFEILARPMSFPMD